MKLNILKDYERGITEYTYSVIPFLDYITQNIKLYGGKVNIEVVI